MKKITLWFFALFTCWQMSAQVGGYSFTEGVGAYAALGGTNITATGDDGTENGLPIGFTFNFGGTDYTTFSATTNGWIRLGGAIPGGAWTNSAFNFSDATFRPLIAAIWDDNNRNTGAISYSVSGASPNQVLTVDYSGVNIGGGGSTSAANLANYQIKLYETTNVVEFHYGTMATAGALTATIGLSDASGFQSVTPGAPGTSSNATGNHAVAAVTNVSNKMYRFTPPTCAAPGGLNASSVTSTTATIGWNAAIPAPTGYEYVVSTSNTTPAGSGTATTNLSEPLTSLLPQTTYYVFVRSNCGGPFSSWNSFSFTTACAPITTYPSLQPFVTFLPNQCWSQGTGGDLTAGPASTGTTGNWYVDGLGNVGSTGAVNYNLYLTGGNDWVISPEYAIPATGYELKLIAAITDYGATTAPVDWDAADTVEILVSTSGLTNWTPLYTYDVSNYGSVLPAGSLNVLDLDAYNGQNVRFAIRAFEGATGRDIDFSFDDFEVRLSPTCPDQTGLTVGTITANTADFSWDNLGTLGYEYAVTTSATPPASGTSTTATIFSASSLSPQTVYYMHVRTACVASTFGNWVTVSFTTGCAPITTYPSLEPFVTFLPNQCWSQGTGGDLTAGPTTTGTTGNWYVDGLGNVGNTGAVNYNLYTTGGNDWVISPEYAIPASGYELKLIAAITDYGATTAPNDWDAGDTVEILVSTTGLTNWTPLYTYDVSNYGSVLPAGSLNVLDLDAYNGQTVRFAIRAFEGASGRDIDFSFDNFEVRLSPTCPDQTGLTIGTVTSTTADFSWDNLGTLGYEYAVTTSATPPVSGTSTTATIYAASGLSPQTVYYMHVRASCAGATFGNWATVTFTTACAPIATLPWIENFDSVTTPAFPPCWSEENGDYQTSNSTFDNTPHSGTNYLRDAWSATNEFMWTPGFELVAGISYDFSSWIQGDGGSGWVVDYFVNSTQNSASSTQLGATYNVPGTGTLSIQPHVQVTRSFVPGSTGTYYFAVRVNQPSFSPNYVAFDDFELKLSPACPTPSASASNITDASADLSWAAVPSATLGYEYVLDNVATDPAGAGTSTLALAYAASGLTQSTTYYFHIRSVCSVGTYSTWSTVSFVTLATPPVNDNCGTAIAVSTIPYTNTQDATAASQSAFVTACGNTMNDGVWYTVVGNGYDIIVDVNAVIGWDPQIDVYTGSCGTFTCVGSADVGGTSGSESFTIPASVLGTTYYINVGHYSGFTNSPEGPFTINVSSPLNANGFDKSNFVAYPNPVKDVLNLSYKTAISNVRVINLLGQEVLNTKANSNDVQVNMSALTAGAYIVNITVEDTVHTIKVIKE